MAASKVTVYLLSVLIPLVLINCQESSDFPSTSGLPSFPGIPSIPGMPSIPGIPSFPGLPDFRGKRQTPSDSDSESDDEDRTHDDRLFFSNFGNFFGSVSTTSCNFTTQPERTCLSCTQAMNCASTNTASVTTCHGWFHPYCNSGFCSKTPGTACLSTTTTTTTAAPAG